LEETQTRPTSYWCRFYPVSYKMPDSIYDPSRYDALHPVYTREQCRKGGLKRAAAAKHDKWGRFLPNNDTVSTVEPVDHGKAGGLARVGKARRDNKGRFLTSV
jgi:hypothetical protein